VELPLPVSLRHGMQMKLRLGIEGPGNGTSTTSSVGCINDLYMKLSHKTQQMVMLKLSPHVVRELCRESAQVQMCVCRTYLTDNIVA
jgi:hypothetical protein